MKTIQLPASINDLLNSRGFQSFEESKLGNDLFINDPDRADRIHEAAEHGCDGSTHGEHIDDWREYVEQLYRDEMTDDNEAELDTWRDSLMAKIDACEEWHINNGSLNDQGS